jgi:lipoic acid synthetase
MSQEVEIRALKGKSKVSRLKIKPDAKHLPLRKPQV